MGLNRRGRCDVVEELLHRVEAMDFLRAEDLGGVVAEGAGHGSIICQVGCVALGIVEEFEADTLVGLETAEMLPRWSPFYFPFLRIELHSKAGRTTRWRDESRYSRLQDRTMRQARQGRGRRKSIRIKTDIFLARL
jgi:hypothetical protein